uniref:DUF2179 domain-containing protein n=1 Tax=Ascaris lumbricoides TaxID=6252 RepID=A0A0M3HG60_ASCLU
MLMHPIVEKFLVFLPFGVRQFIEKKINDKDVDCTLFDEAIKHVEQKDRNMSCFSIDNMVHYRPVTVYERPAT